MVVRCVHSNSVLYPLCNVSIKVEGYLVQTVANVSDTLPTSVLLCTDVEELRELLGVKIAAGPTQSSSTSHSVSVSASPLSWYPIFSFCCQVSFILERLPSKRQSLNSCPKFLISFSVFVELAGFSVTPLFCFFFLRSCCFFVT